MTLHRGGQALRTARAQALDRFGPWCGRCGRWIDTRLKGPDPMSLSLGHIQPLSRGGTDHPHNLRPEHLACNVAAGNRIEPPRAAIAKPYRSVTRGG